MSDVISDIFENLNRGNPDQPVGKGLPPDAHFAKTSAVAERYAYQPGEIFLGVVEGYIAKDEATGQSFINGGKLIGLKDDRSLATIANARSGKGRTLILNNLLTYKHSVLALDFKGELASITAKTRSQLLNHCVRVIDPYGIATLPPGISRARYNPLAGLDEHTVIRVAAKVADGIVIPTGKDLHWDEAAKHFIKGVITHVVTDPFYKDRVNLGTVRDVLGEAGDEGRLKDEMLANLAAGGVVRSAARDFFEKPATERSSVLSTARRHLEFLDYPEIRNVLSGHDFSFEDLKSKATTIYLVLPFGEITNSHRWLRLLINMALQDMERSQDRPATGGPVLFLMDEFSSLDRMKYIENSVPHIAGYGVLFWFILQDLSLLKSTYLDKWETFLGNTGTLIFFGNNDLTTLEWITRRCGKTTIKVPRETPMSAEHAIRDGLTNVTWNSELHDLLTVDETSRFFGRSDEQSRQLILRADGLPIVLQRVFYDLHDHFKGLVL